MPPAEAWIPFAWAALAVLVVANIGCWWLCTRELDGSEE